MPRPALMTRPAIYRTRQLIAVADLFLTEPGRARHAYEVADATGVPLCTVYCVLKRMATVRWMTRGREAGQLRLMYRLTTVGEVQLGRMLS